MMDTSHIRYEPREKKLSSVIAKEVAVHFRDELRSARAAVLSDGEAFDQILFIIERLGIHLTRAVSGLGKYEAKIAEVAAHSSLAGGPLAASPARLTDFPRLYRIVTHARNDALHVGAYARHLASCCVELALVLEDALMSDTDLIRNFMVKNPVTASAWQPLALIRQTMLASSFSYLPVRLSADSVWALLSDYELCKFLRSSSSNAQRQDRLALTLADVLDSAQVVLEVAVTCAPDDTVDTALRLSRGKPVLVVDNNSQEMVGIVTPFDLL